MQLYQDSCSSWPWWAWFFSFVEVEDPPKVHQLRVVFSWLLSVLYYAWKAKDNWVSDVYGIFGKGWLTDGGGAVFCFTGMLIEADNHAERNCQKCHSGWWVGENIGCQNFLGTENFHWHFYSALFSIWLGAFHSNPLFYLQYNSTMDNNDRHVFPLACGFPGCNRLFRSQHDKWHITMFTTIFQKLARVLQRITAAARQNIRIIITKNSMVCLISKLLTTFLIYDGISPLS